MDVVDDSEAGPSLRGIRIARYKNLSEQWIPWADGIALFGANGVGKTNTLEALAILAGTEQTLGLAHRRLSEVSPRSLEIVAEVSADELPWAPSLLPVGNADPEPFAEEPAFARVNRDARWWSGIGADAGVDFLDAFAGLDLPEGVLAYLAEQVRRPVIRYTLTAFAVEVEGGEYNGNPGLVRVKRAFTRTLMGLRPPREIVSAAHSLPDVFAPLRTALATPLAEPEGLIDLLALSDSDRVPVKLEWIARTRTSDEVTEHLRSRLRIALYPASDLAAGLVARSFVAEDYEPDAYWWLHHVLTRAANDELRLTLPYVRVEPLGANDAEVELLDTRGPEPQLIGRTWDIDALERFSAGERRWVDEALSTAGRELDHFAVTAAWQAKLLDQIDEANLADPLIYVADQVRQLLTGVEFWNAEALFAVQAACEGPLLAEARRQRSALGNPVMRGVIAAISGLPDARRPLVLRVFDEPEAHLHPAMQREIAVSLERLRLRGDNVIVASHSPHFLDLPGWQLLHVQRTGEGTTVSPLTPADLDARRTLAGQMGLTRGELLTRVSYVLIVEGNHDQLILETQFKRLLDESGVAILRMHGTSNLLATAEMDFVSRYLDVPVGVMLDYVRLDKVAKATSNRGLRSEEKALREFEREYRSRGLSYKTFALERPDVVSYLNEDAIRADHPGFPGWKAVLERFEALSSRPSFKDWLARDSGFHVDLRTADKIRPVLDRMGAQGLPVEAELDGTVRRIASIASARRWPEPLLPSG